MAAVWSIVVAGGAGSRFGAPKQHAILGGRPVLEWSVLACRPHSEGVVLVLPGTEVRAQGAARLAAHHGVQAVVAGGATRADSVRRGLAAVPGHATVIVVHDAARPLATPALFGAVIDALGDPSVAGAVPGLTPADTIKVVDPDGWVERTLARERLVAVQTPQAFVAEVLRRAHRDPGPEATDDAVVVERAGGRVRVVPGEVTNLKITQPGDLDRAERILSEGAGSAGGAGGSGGHGGPRP